VIEPEAGRLVGGITVGTKPTCSAVTPDGRFAFATVTGRRELAVVDTGRDEVIARLPLGDSPKGVEVTPEGRFVLVANEGAGSHSVSIFAVGS